MRFAGVDARAYDFALERSTPDEYPRLSDRAKALRADGWDVEILAAEWGGQVVSVVLLACRYREELKAASG